MKYTMSQDTVFLKKVYQNALLIELKKKGLDVIPNKKIMVYNKGENVGDYYADIIVNNTVILELKAAEYIIDQFENQLLNYLKGTNCEIGLLLNFGKKPEFRRKIYENKRKKIEKISFNQRFAIANQFNLRTKKNGFTRPIKKPISRPYSFK